MYWWAHFRAWVVKKTAPRVKLSRLFIKKYRDRYPPKVLARALGISASRVYFILKNEEKMKPRKDKFVRREEVTAKIKLLAEQYPYFGYRKIYAILKYKEGITVRRNTVYRVMKESKSSCQPPGAIRNFLKEYRSPSTSRLMNPTVCGELIWPIFGVVRMPGAISMQSLITTTRCC